MKKILFLVDYELGGLGGAQKSTLTCIKQVIDQYECHVLSPETGEVRNGISGVRMHYFKRRGNSACAFISKIFGLINAVADASPDYIHAQFSQMGLVLMVYAFCFKRSKAKCIFTDRDFFDAYNKMYKWCFRHFGKRMYRIVCTTETNAERWKREVPKARVNIIPNVLDSTWEDYDRNKKLKWKERSQNRKFVVGFVGRFVSFKRWDVAYDIAESLNDENMAFIFVISTFNPDETLFVEYVGKLKKLSNVELMINANQEEVSEAYYRMDLFVLTSENESFGRTLIEAMSRGTAVIGSDSGGAPEVIGRPEYLFPVGCVTEAVVLIRKFAENKELCDKNKEYGLKRVALKFSLEAQKTMLLDLYGVSYED